MARKFVLNVMLLLYAVVFTAIIQASIAPNYSAYTLNPEYTGEPLVLGWAKQRIEEKLGPGNVTTTHNAWCTIEGAPYVHSLIVEGDYLLTVNNFFDLAFCYEAATGKIIWKERLGRQHTSPVSANGLVYFLNDNCLMNVIKPGAEFLRVAQNEIHEKAYASPAISQGKIFLRGYEHLFCIGSESTKKPY